MNRLIVNNCVALFFTVTCVSVIFTRPLWSMEQKAPKKLVAILDFHCIGLSNAYARILRDSIEEALLKNMKFRIFLKDKVKVLLENKNIRLDESDAASAVEIGRIINVDWVVVGRIEKKITGDEINILLWVVDVKNKKTMIKVDKYIKNKKEFFSLSRPFSENFSQDMVDLVHPQKGLDVTIGLTGYSIAPIGRFREIAHGGWGVLASVNINHVCIANNHIGFDVGFWRFASYYKSVSSILMLPVFLTDSYDFFITEKFSLSPLISIGGSYTAIEYNLGGFSNTEEPSRSLTAGLEFVGRAGIDLHYYINSSHVFNASIGYGFLVEKSGLVPFLMLGAGIGIIF